MGSCTSWNRIYSSNRWLVWWRPSIIHPRNFNPSTARDQLNLAHSYSGCRWAAGFWHVLTLLHALHAFMYDLHDWLWLTGGSCLSRLAALQTEHRLRGDRDFRQFFFRVSCAQRWLSGQRDRFQWGSTLSRVFTQKDRERERLASIHKCIHCN